MTTAGPPPPVPEGAPQGWPPPQAFPPAGTPGAAQPPAASGYPPGAHPAYPYPAQPGDQGYVPGYPGAPGAPPAQAYPYPAPPGMPPTPPGGGLAYPAPYPGGPPPAPPSRRSRSRKLLPVIAISLAAAAGAAYPIYRDAQRAAAAQSCEIADARVVTLAKLKSDDPTIRLPLTPGWTQLDFTKETWLGPRVQGMRGFFANNSIREDDYSPDLSVNVYVTPESPAAAIKKIFDSDTENAITNRATETICGATVSRADFSAPDHFRPGSKPALGTLVVQTITGPIGELYVVEASISTKHPENPAYVAQRDALLKGLRVSLP
jgi:hypothetical protein